MVEKYRKCPLDFHPCYRCQSEDPDCLKAAARLNSELIRLVSQSGFSGKEILYWNHLLLWTAALLGVDPNSLEDAARPHDNGD